MEEYPRNYFVDRNNNRIHHTATIGSNVILGKNNHIRAFVNIEGNTTIGDGNDFFPFTSIGTEPEHKTFYGAENKGVIIGNNNVIREYVTINAGCYRATELGNGIWMLRGSHAGHDAIINDNCTISCNVLIGGHSYIGHESNLGLGAILHQFSVIGGGAMVGMGCVITKKTPIEPFKTYVGNPAKFLKENSVKKEKMTPEQVQKVIEKYLNQLENNNL
jgi:UDP-N-acetylglucosamine acyltransferase